MSEQAKQNLKGMLGGSAAALSDAIGACAGCLDKADADGWTPRHVIVHATFAGGEGVSEFARGVFDSGQLEIEEGGIPPLPNLEQLSLAELQGMVSSWKANSEFMIDGLTDSDLQKSVTTPFGAFTGDQLLGLLFGMHPQDHVGQLKAFAAQ